MHEDQPTGEDRWGDSGVSPLQDLEEWKRKAWDWSHKLVFTKQVLVSHLVGHDPQLLLTDERGTVQHSAYAQVLAFRRAYPQIVDIYRKFAHQAMQLTSTPTLDGMFGQVYGRNLQGRDPEMIEAILPQGEAVVLGTGRLIFDPPIQRIRHEKVPTVYVLDFETDFSEIEEQMLRRLDRKREAVNTQMLMYALGGLAHETRFDMVKGEPFDDEPTKQNGRSASYLKHDKTKSHKRRKRK